LAPASCEPDSELMLAGGKGIARLGTKVEIDELRLHVRDPWCGPSAASQY
jgi:hypothetical protein